MDKKEMLKAIGEADDELVEQAANAGAGTSRAKRFLAVAASLAIVCTAVFACFIGFSTGAKLEKSEGVKVRKPLLTFSGQQAYDLVCFTEDELINGAQYNIDSGSPVEVFSGTVTDIENISVSFGGEREDWCLVSVEVSEVLRGTCQKGDTVKIQCHFPVGSADVWVEDTSVISQLKKGMKGIFLPMKYSEEARITMNGATLFESEIAPYGFGDGERGAFLEGEDGLIYAEFAYPSVPAGSSLEDVEAFIRSIIK